jgi:hypothetical protein
MIRLGLIAVMFLLVTTSSARAADLGKFVGHWSCTGSFSNGKPIAASLSIETDALSGALVVRHDDLPPAGYHSLEVWTPNKSGQGLRAALSDRFSGMRWFESAGWTGDILVWVRSENGMPAEQFTYEFKADILQVQWSMMKDGAMKVGDTIACNRA